MDRARRALLVTIALGLCANLVLLVHAQGLSTVENHLQSIRTEILTIGIQLQASLQRSASTHKSADREPRHDARSVVRAIATAATFSGRPAPNANRLQRRSTSCDLRPSDV